MTYDVIVVGGSFAGQSAAMQLARARRTVLVIDAGRPRNRFADATHGFLGHDGRKPSDIISQASQQLAAYPTIRQIRAEAVQAEKNDDGFTLALADGQQERAARIVLATGISHELLPIQRIHLDGLSVFRSGSSVARSSNCLARSRSLKPFASKTERPSRWMRCMSRPGPI